MNNKGETIKQNTVDGDGTISKAEARAKRKEAKKQNKAPKKESVDNKVVENIKNESSNNKPAVVRVVEVERKKNNVKAMEEDGGEILQRNNATNNAQINKTESAESKAELRAKRRAIQEAQRQAKLKEKLPETKLENKNVQEIKRIASRRESISVVSGGNFHKQVQLFNHLYQHHSVSLTKCAHVHRSIIRLGAQYMSHQILGSNARCLALLAAIKQLVLDFKTPAQQDFCRSLELTLQSSTDYLQKCRPSAVSMTNAVRNIKWQLTQLDTNLSDKDKKTKLMEGIETYINDEIGMADKAISLTVQNKIIKGDVILTYGCSSVVMRILLDAHLKGKVFNVIVVDARPLLEGREMLRKLVNAGINCSYVLIAAASFIMGKVSKVLLGAHSLLANGYVMSRAGTAQVALIAQSFNKPVLVCCETYKFCERVQTDSIVHNEIGDPDKLVNCSPLSNWKQCKNVTPLNLMYDVTPPDLVTAVVTELAILPCTSVPVILRIKPTELAL